MVQDTKQVKSVKSNAPKKGWKIEWTDGKFDNIFDEAWLPILDEAQKTGQSIHIEKEKNNAGYWNIVKLELAVNPKPEISSEKVIAPQEKGMWWKEVGENFRAGLFKKDEGNGALLWRAYITQMLSSLDITIEKTKK